MGFHFSPMEAIAIVNLVVAPTTAAANFSESKVKNPIISTICKIVQLIPSAFLLYYTILAETSVYQHSGHISGINAAFKTASFVGISILAMPILITTLKKVAEYQNWNNLEKALDVFEKHYMTLAKIVNIAINTLGLIGLCSFMIPFGGLPISQILIGTAYLSIFASLLVLNVYETIQQLRSTGNPIDGQTQKTPDLVTN